jgi:cell division septation protein DedD
MSSTQEDSFREIQLSGKALVFVFMAGIVILVAVFLMGLQVGRGVLAARGPAGSEAVVTETEPPPPPAAATSGSSTTPATAGEKLSYAERLGSQEPAREQLKAEATPPPPEPTPRADAAPATPEPAPPVAKSAPASPPAKPATPAAAVTAEPAGAGFAIQVAALREREEADVIAKRLAGKGYPAYVVSPSKGERAAIFRVRVGKYKDRAEADTIAARLQKEEQFKPWIVR